MGIFDDLLVNAKSAANTVGKKAGDLVDVSKLKISSAEASADIAKLYQAIGEYVVTNLRDKVAEDPELAGKIAEVDGLQEKVEVIQKALADKKNKTICDKCGTENDNTASFCHNCGEKLPEPPAPEVEEPVATEPTAETPVEPTAEPVAPPTVENNDTQE